MKLLRWLGVLCVLGGACFALDRNAFTFTNYSLEVRVDPAGQAIAARGRITLRNDSRTAQGTVALQISSSLEWRLIGIVGQEKAPQYEIHPYTTDIDHTGSVTEAIVTLPAPLGPRSSLQLEIGYSGDITADATRLTRMGVPAQVAAQSDWDQVSESFTALRGVGHVIWYPVAMEAANLSEGQLFSLIAAWQQREAEAAMRVQFCWITAEEPETAAHLTVVANGQLETIGQGPPQAASEEGGNATGCLTYRFTSLGMTVPAFALGKFQVLGRPVVNVYQLGQHGQVAAGYAAAAEKAAPFVAGWFGALREKVQVVELNDANAVPYESGAMLFTPLRAADAKLLELSMTHQLVHASFASARPWIFEGLANFGQALEREQQEGRKAAIAFMQINLPLLVAAEKDVCAVSSSKEGGARNAADCAYGQPLAAAYDEVYSRVKAMYVWWMLRDMVGDPVLQHALNAYVASKDKEPSYFQRLLEAEAKRDLEWFFDDWVYRDRGLPDFRVFSAYPRPLVREGYVVTVTAEDLTQPGAEVVVTVRTEGGEKVKRLEVRGMTKATTRLEVPAAPTEVLVNDGSVPESNTGNNSFSLPVPAKPQ